ncbi:MAG: 4Fe-4S binding protein [Christensenellales bacterium]|jgi:MinD superfamily P-loop ATPase
MKKLLILSGKGGTGKTTIAAAFIRFSEAKAFADCDVDAPNLHIVTRMNSAPKRSDYYGSKKAGIDEDRCVGCMACMEACRFDAITYEDGKCAVNEYSCEGCGVCAFVCPTDAANLHEDVAGELTLYTDERVFSTAELKMGRGNSGLLVSEVKSTMLKAAPDAEFAIFDGPPGIGCPVIASVSGMDLVLIVTEPSVSGMSDLTRILKTASILHTKVAVCVNKFDVCEEQADGIEAYCEENEVPFVGRIPYDKRASAAINAGQSLADTDCPARDALMRVYDRVMRLLGAQK